MTGHTPSQQMTTALRRDDYALRGEIADAIREYCHSVSPAAVQDSHGIERIYYAGISLDGLADAVFAAVTSASDKPEEITGAEMDAIEAASVAGKPLMIPASGDVRAAVIEALDKTWRSVLSYPFGKVCKHLVAANILSDMENLGAYVPEDLAKAVVECDDTTALGWAALSQSPATDAAGGWQPIETAPVGKTPHDKILVGFMGQFSWMPFVAFPNGNETCAPGYAKPTHWMPLPNGLEPSHD